MQPTEAQLAALARFQRRYGRIWKAHLRSLWLSDQAYEDGALLRQLRNNFGPEWLNAYRPGDLQVGHAVKCYPRGQTKMAWVITDLDHRYLACRQGVKTKRELQAIARKLKITLLD